MQQISHIPEITAGLNGTIYKGQCDPTYRNSQSCERLYDLDEGSDIFEISKQLNPVDAMRSLSLHADTMSRCVENVSWEIGEAVPHDLFDGFVNAHVRFRFFYILFC